MGLIAIVIFVALLAFTLTDFLSGITRIISGPPDAGVVAGESVPDQTYRARVNDILARSGGSGDEVRSGQLRDQVWNQMVSEIVFDRELEDVGLEVTGAEIYDMFAGANISPYVRQYFQPLFPDGNFDPEQVKRYLDIVNQNPEERARLKQFEADLARARGVERYLNMIQAAFLGSNAAARARFAEQNKKVNLSFLAVSYAAVPDSTIPVSDAELRSFMRKQGKIYEQKAETYIRYVSFPLRPSQKDSSNAYGALARLKTSFATIADDSVYTSAKSRFPYSKDYQAVYDLPEAIRDSVVGAAPKTVFGPMMERGFYKLYKLVGTQTAEQAAAKVNHILITYQADSAAALAKASDLARQARGGADFAQLAADNSDDFNSKTKGGALGWYRRTQFGEDFDKAIDEASAGSIVGPIKGRGGYHVVQIVAKTKLTYDIAEIEEEIIYSSATRDSVYGEANLFASQLMQVKDINDAAATSNVVAYESSALNDQSRDIMGLNGGREMIVWALYADIGEISKVMRVNDFYVIAQVTDRKPEGLKDLEEVRDEVLAKVRSKKKGEQIARQLREIGGEDLNAIKDAFGQGATVSTANNVNFDATTIAGIGNDRIVVGRALSLPQGIRSEPIIGERGVYILQVTSITEAPEPSEEALTGLKESIATQGKTSLQSKVEAALIKLADVKDKRAEAEARGYGYK
ncbi:MAG: hypothetical protein OHK0039_01570 [Bacteroidia bacterium]